MSVARVDITAARRLVAKLVLNLTAAANGEIVARAAAKIQAQIDAVAKRILSKHVLSGRALSQGSATRSGTLIQLSTPAYIGFALGRGWPFRSGMPPFVLSNAVKILQAELNASLTGQASPLALADEAAEEAAIQKSRAKYKADNARIYRQSAAGKAAAKAARQLARKAGA